MIEVMRGERMGRQVLMRFGMGFSTQVEVVIPLLGCQTVLRIESSWVVIGGVAGGRGGRRSGQGAVDCVNFGLKV